MVRGCAVGRFKQHLSLCICIVITGSLNGAKNGAIMETGELEDCEDLGEGVCSSDEVLEKLKLCISLFCHALRSQVSLPLCGVTLRSQCSALPASDGIISDSSSFQQSSVFEVHIVYSELCCMAALPLQNSLLPCAGKLGTARR